MRKNNLQIRISPQVDQQIAELSPQSKSEFVRRAIEEKIQREEFRKLEEQWVQALQKDPENVKETEKWLKAEVWGDK